MRKCRLTTAMMTLLLLCNASCRKRPAPLTEIPLADERLHTAVYFRPPGYFIYRDSATGNTDSFSVRYYTPESQENKDGTYTLTYLFIAEHTAVQATDMLRVRANTNYLSATWNRSGSSPDDTNYYQMRFARLPLSIGTHEHVDSVEGYPAIDSVSFQYLNHYDSLIVAGKVYRDVQEAESKTYYDVAHGKAVMRFHSFYSMNDGLVRFEKGSMLQKPQVMELVASKIIR